MTKTCRWGSAGVCLLTMAGAVQLRAQSVQARPDSAPIGATYVLPAKDSVLQLALRRVLREAPFRALVDQRQLSVALVDLTDSTKERYAAVDENRMRYAASLPKVAIMLAVFQAVEDGRLTYSPALRAKLERMIRRSENRVSTELIELVGFEWIERTLRDPAYELYNRGRAGGLWVGRDYGGGVGLWKRDPIANMSHGATARQVARFLVMLERKLLVSPWASTEMKAIMGNPAIEHKFVLGLKGRPRSRIFRKSGTWRDYHADAAIVERDGRRYAAVALMESSQRGVFANLIVRLDDIIIQTAPRLGQSEQP